MAWVIDGVPRPRSAVQGVVRRRAGSALGRPSSPPICCRSIRIRGRQFLSTSSGTRGPWRQPCSAIALGCTAWTAGLASGSRSKDHRLSRTKLLFRRGLTLDGLKFKLLT